MTVFILTNAKHHYIFFLPTSLYLLSFELTSLHQHLKENMHHVCVELTTQTLSFIFSPSSIPITRRYISLHNIMREIKMKKEEVYKWI